jgi:hypothetical protein
MSSSNAVGVLLAKGKTIRRKVSSAYRDLPEKYPSRGRSVKIQQRPVHPSPGVLEEACSSQVKLILNPEFDLIQ